ETTVISFSGGIGTVTISGTDSIWTNTDYVDLNYNGGGATINIGAASVLPGDATSPGTLKARSILFRAGSDAHGTSTLNFNHTGSNYVFATPLVSYGTGAKDSLNHYAGTHCSLATVRALKARQR
ncbi:MAG TPA: hypothetical protein VL002_05070, partial [Candidimonas sp.]|nr:hypothetical protein [Candidimonas sp.]